MKNFCVGIIVLLITQGCKEKYVPAISSPLTGYLVVEGYINSGAAPTKITLSRTTKLLDTVKIQYEINAVVNIQNENLENFPLYETINGVYLSSSLILNSNNKYRLHIKTAGNKEYVSNFSAVKSTPAIDSLTWHRDNDGLKIYVNTHDPQNKTRYYRWAFDETWEIHSAYISQLKYVKDPVTDRIRSVMYKVPSPDTTIFKCWRSVNSTNIYIGSSEKLSADVIYLPLAFIEPASEKISVLYSIRFKQYALSREAYMFFEKIKKNTEQLGSIFDPQPSELKGNIICITDPAEIVVGYVDISEEKEQRIFISNAEVPGWNHSYGCNYITIDNHPDSIFKYGIGLLPTDVAAFFQGGAIAQFFASSPGCVDCTLKGSNIRPPFWP